MCIATYRGWENDLLTCQYLYKYVEQYVLYYNTGGLFWRGVASFATPTSPTSTACRGVYFIADGGIRRGTEEEKGNTALKVKDLHMFQAHLHIILY